MPNPWGPRNAGGGAGASPPTNATPQQQGLFNTPGMQSLLGQMSENPHLIQSMLSSPYFQNMLQAFEADPPMATQIISQVLNVFCGYYYYKFINILICIKCVFQNPLFGGNNQLQDQLRTMMPQILTQLQNPEVQQMMTNPQVDYVVYT